MAEFDRIRNYFLPLTDSNAMARDLADDAAVIQPVEDTSFVVTTDALTEGIHFFPDTQPSLIAQKALRVNLSDLAAMGATPHAYTLSLLIPHHCDDTWIDAFCHGLAEDQERFGIQLIGGDSSSIDGPVTLSITAFGLAKHHNLLSRSGAQSGDDVWVSGSIGDAFLGLHAIKQQQHHHEALINRYHLPQPRIILGQALHGMAHSAIDVSDGLLQDLEHICHASAVGADIQLQAIPVSDIAREYTDGHHINPVDLLAGGDDYELLFTASPDCHSAIETLSRKLSLPLTCIGAMKDGHDVTLRDEDGDEITMQHKGYQHC